MANGVIAVAEGANMPTTLDATEYLQSNGVFCHSFCNLFKTSDIRSYHIVFLKTILFGSVITCMEYIYHNNLFYTVILFLHDEKGVYMTKEQFAAHLIQQLYQIYPQEEYFTLQYLLFYLSISGRGK